jgi:hypothetical protein
MRTLIAVLVLAAVAAASASAALRPPSLRVVDRNPVVVQGLRFGSSQPVRVTVLREGRTLARRTVRTGAGGGFVARFAALASHRCDGGLQITARSASGRFAVAKVPQALCPMPLRPDP